MRLQEAIQEILKMTDEAYTVYGAQRARRMFDIALGAMLGGDETSEYDIFGFVKHTTKVYNGDPIPLNILTGNNGVPIKLIKVWAIDMRSGSTSIVTEMTSRDKRLLGDSGLAPIYDLKYSITNGEFSIYGECSHNLEIDYVMDIPKDWDNQTELNAYLTTNAQNVVILQAVNLLKQEVSNYEG